MIAVKKYSEKLHKEWDKFIISSNNGTIFQTQKFLGYHNKKKFKDFSLIIHHNNSPIAVIPGALLQKKDEKIFYSHPGASFGGFVLKKNLSFDLIEKSVSSKLPSKKFSIELKNLSLIFGFCKDTCDLFE